MEEGGFCSICGARVKDAHRCDQKRLDRIDALHRSASLEPGRNVGRTKLTRLKEGFAALRDDDPADRKWSITKTAYWLREVRKKTCPWCNRVFRHKATFYAHFVVGNGCGDKGSISMAEEYADRYGFIA